MSSNIPPPPADHNAQLREILEAGAAAAEEFADNSKTIYTAYATGTLQEWVERQIPDEYRPIDSAGRDESTPAGSGVGGEALAEGEARA